MSFEDQILKAVQSVMPRNADIQVVPGIGLFNICVSWKLNNDPDRPNKMSKTISIRVSQEAAQDFASASASNQAGAFQRVSTFLEQQYRQFEPDHDAKKYEVPPVVQWVISSEVITG